MLTALRGGRLAAAYVAALVCILAGIVFRAVRLGQAALCAPMFIDRAQVEAIDKGCRSLGKSGGTCLVEVFARTKDQEIVLQSRLFGGPFVRTVPSYLSPDGHTRLGLPVGLSARGLLSDRPVPLCSLVWLTGEQARVIDNLCSAPNNDTGPILGIEILRRTDKGIVVSAKSASGETHVGRPFLVTDNGALSPADSPAPNTRMSFVEILKREHRM